MTDAKPSTHSSYESLFTVICGTILVGAETVGAGFATGWAIGGFLHLDLLWQRICEGVFSALGVFLMLVFFRTAYRNTLARNHPEN